MICVKAINPPRVWAYSATLFLSSRAYLYPWHWEKVPPGPVSFPVDERTLHIAWVEMVWGTWPIEVGDSPACADARHANG
jgi:hypothetical protein